MPGGFDHAIEAIGRGDTIRLAWDVLRPGGQATVVGIAPAGVEVSLPALDLLNEKTLRGCYYGSADVAAELPGLVALAASGEIDLASVVSHFTDLDGIEEALQRLRRGEGARTVVIVDPELAGRGVGVERRIPAMIAVTFTGAGGSEVVRVEERPDPVPGDHEVLIRATHAGLNPADLAQRAGRYPAPAGSPQDIPGSRCRAESSPAARAVTAWREGDRVFGIVGGGGLADTVVAHERHVTGVPDSLDDRDAAAVPEAFVTAHDAVFTRAGLAMGETLLVNGATGGVGTAGVQMGVAVGARVLANARCHHDKLAELGAEPVALDDAAGVDVVLELVGAQNLAGQPRRARAPRPGDRRRHRRGRRRGAVAAGADGQARERDGDDAARPGDGGEGRGGAGVRASGRAAARERPGAAVRRPRVPGRGGRRRVRPSRGVRASSARCCSTSAADGLG